MSTFDARYQPKTTSKFIEAARAYLRKAGRADRDISKVIFTRKNKDGTDIGRVDGEGVLSKQCTEKRLVRAMFEKHLIHINGGALGKVIDYEIPLPANGVGEIDLMVSRNPNDILFIEAKRPDSTESSIRAILEIYTYLMCLKKNKQVGRLTAEANIILNNATASSLQVVPAVLVFDGTHAARQFKEYNSNSGYFKKCIDKITESLVEAGYSRIEVFIADITHFKSLQIMKYDNLRRPSFDHGIPVAISDHFKIA